MKWTLRKIGAYISYGLGMVLVVAALRGEGLYLLLVSPGYFSLGMILDGYADSQEGGQPK